LEIGAEFGGIHRHASATLAYIEQQQRALRVTRSGDARGIEQHGVVKAHEAHGDHARSRSHGGEKIVRGDEAFAGRDNSQHDAFACFHGFPGGVLHGEFAFGG
jgi:hypothetical protein